MIWKYYQVVLFFLLFLITACKSVCDSDVIIIDAFQSFENDLELNSVDSVFIPEIIELAGWKITNDKVIFMSYGLHENFIRVYSYPEFHLLYSGGRKGQGPDEFVTINWGDAKQKNEFIIYDIMNSKLNLYVTSSDSISCMKWYDLGHGSDGVCKPYTRILHLNDNRFLMKYDSPNESKLEIVDLDKKKIVAQQENLLRKRYEKRMSYTPFDFNFSVWDDHLLVTYNYVDRMELYDINSEQISLRMIVGNPDDQSELKDYNSLKCYHVSLISDNRFFYCLKSKGGSDLEGDVIEVYDEKLTPLYRLQLRQSLESISVDSHGILWGYKEDKNGFYLYKYNMEF